VARVSAGGLDRGIFGSFEETGTGQAVTGSLGVQFSVYLGRQTARSRLTIAQMSRRQAGIRIQESENRVVQEVRAALHDLAAAKARATTAAGEIGSARSSVEGEQLKERNGESTPFRVLEKEDLLTQAVTREDRAAADVRIATARLWKAIGMLREARSLPRPAACR
jgi:outer membrane protein TolC